jgi:16S rRNA (guanine527-N7)-methyltransferase
MSAPDLLGALRQGAQVLGVALSPQQEQTLLDYVGWIAKWNRVYNLTAVRDPHDMLVQHILDSLTVVPALRRYQTQAQLHSIKVLDVGAGAGLPGVVLAIACPDVQVACVDTVAKKALFIGQVAAALRLPNLRGIHARVENLQEAYDVVTSRAFASLADFTQWSASSLAPHGVWMAMKGKHPEAELAELPSKVEVFHVEPLNVPGLDAERCLIWMRPQHV